MGNDQSAALPGRPALRLAAPRYQRLLREFALLPVLAIVIVIGAVTANGFLSYDNIMGVLEQSSELAIVTLALTIILIAGSFDLSLESTLGVAPLVCGWLILPVSSGGGGVGLDPAIGLLMCFVVGAAIGVMNAFLVVKLRLNAFVVTLAVLILLRGVHLGITNGGTLYDLPSSVIYLGTGKIAGLPASVLLAAGLFLIFGVVMRYHRIGRALYAIGGNPDAARAAGVNVERMMWGAFILASMLAALAGIMLTGRLGAVTPDQGNNYIFTVFAAAVIGGVSLNGGRGSLVGALTGVLLLGVISNILILSQVPSFWIEAVYGVIILLALILARLTGREEGS